MEKKIDVRKAGALYLAGTLFNKGIGFITVPIFTRILTMEAYGIVTTYNSWVSMLGIFMSLAMYMGIRASFVDYENKTMDFFSTVISFTLLYGVCLSGLIVVGVTILPISIDLGLVIACLINSVASAVIENASMYFMMKYNYKARTAIMVLPNLISTIISIVLIKHIFIHQQHWGRILPNVITTLLSGIVIVIYSFSRSKVHFNVEYIRYSLRISAPLVLHGIALSILSQSDRTMITAIRNTKETAIYGLIYNFSMIATVLTTSLDGIWIPFFTEKMKNNEYDEINLLSKKYIRFITVVILCVILVAPEIVKILATESYWEGISIVPPIVLANYFIFLYTMYVNIEHFHKKTLFISINTIIAACTNILLNLIYIKNYGYVGAAYATVASYVISFVLHYYYSRKLNKILFPLRYFLMPTLFVIIIILLFYVFIDNWIIRWGIAITCMLMWVLYERKMIVSLLRKRKE